ncbi:MAG: transposase, partial [Clostridiales bacterium]
NERGFFLTNITVESLNDALSVIKKYSKRWPCEEAIRFVKQSFHLEDVRVQSYLSLRRMMIFAMIAYEFICLLIRRLLVKNKKVFFYLKSLTIKRNKEVIFVHYKITEAIVKLSAWAMIANMNFT